MAKKVVGLSWHPVADNILASISADNSIKIWDVEAGSAAYTFEDSHGKDPDCALHSAWNTNGSLFLTTGKTGKDFSLKIWDPRDGKGAAQSTGAVVNANKKSPVYFADNLGLLVGVVVSSSRKIVAWDPKKLDVPLSSGDLDSSSSTVTAYYDTDNSIFWIAGRGDSTIRYFEVTKDEKPFFALSEFRDNLSQKGACFLPKRGLDVKSCEIAKALRVLESSIVPISFQVPRKSDLFQKDLFPDTYAGVASLSASEWKSGSNADPKLISLNPKDAGASAVAKSKTPAEIESEITKVKAKLAELEIELEKAKAGK